MKRLSLVTVSVVKEERKRRTKFYKENKIDGIAGLGYSTESDALDIGFV